MQESRGGEDKQKQLSRKRAFLHSFNKAKNLFVCTIQILNSG